MYKWWCEERNESEFEMHQTQKNKRSVLSGGEYRASELPFSLRRKGALILENQFRSPDVKPLGHERFFIY